MGDCAVVTGAGSGIGRALSLELCRLGIPVLGAGRREDALEGTRAAVERMGAACFTFVSADVGTEEGRARIFGALPATARVRYLALMAGAFPIQQLSRITMSEWRDAFAVNVEGRLFLVQALLPRLAEGARILFAKSGSSETPRIGCLPVCASTAASLMVQKCLRLELAERGILVTSARPGFVDTEMMAQTLAASPEVFPDITKIRSHPTVSARTCGRFMSWLLVRCAGERFQEDGWSIEDPGHHPEWLGDAPLYQARAA